MILEPRRRKSSTVTFSVPDETFHSGLYSHRTSSFAESDLDYEPTITTISPTAVLMARAVRSVKTFKKSWDSDRALKSTYHGKVGKYQLRSYIFLALGYAIVVGWLAEMPTFALSRPNTVVCGWINDTNGFRLNSTLPPPSTTARSKLESVSQKNILTNTSIQQNTTTRPPKQIRILVNSSKETGRTVLTEFDQLCSPIYEKITHVVYLIGLVLGGLILGYIADHSGRKMILIGSFWAAAILSTFQLLSEDHISYVFFSFFVGIIVGAVQVITVPYIIEMFPIESRAIYGLSLTAVVFLFDLMMPGFAFGLKNWKWLQCLITVPLLITAVLYWFCEESMFWYASQKDYVTAVESLSKIARFNGLNFEDAFREARDFLRGKRSKGIQCDFLPLLRLEDIKLLSLKYPDFDMADLQATTEKKSTFSQKLAKILTGHHYYPTLSTFYPTDFLHSSTLSIYLLFMCGLWLISSLTEYSLDAPNLKAFITNDFFYGQLYKYLVQLGSIVVAFPMVYKLGRRWTTFCFFLIAEVCLLGSFAIQNNSDDNRTAVMTIYFVGKFASRAGFLVILLFTAEIFPTGLRCTSISFCYTFRLIGVAFASEEILGFNDRTARLIYGILCLILGSMVLLLPETKKLPLPRTMFQVEMIPTSISKKFRRQRSAPVKHHPRPETGRGDTGTNFNDGASTVSGVRSVRFGGPYDMQSTMHSVYELQEFGQDDTVYSLPGRGPRRVDSRNPAIFQPYTGVPPDSYRHPPKTITEEFDEDFDEGRTHFEPSLRMSDEQKKQKANRPEEDPLVPPSTVNVNRQSFNEVPTSVEANTQMPRVLNNNDVPNNTVAGNDEPKEEDDRSQTSVRIVDESQNYRTNMSEDENYFSEHC